MVHRASNLIAFPMPPTSCYDHSSAERNLGRLSKPPPRSNSIPIQLRSVVVNLSTLQQSMHQNPSREMAHSTYLMHHAKSATESHQQTTLVQIPHFPRRRADTHRVQGYHPPLPLNIRQPSDAAERLSGAQTSRSRYPITYNLPTTADRRRMVPPSYPGSSTIRAKALIHEQCATTPKLKQTGDSASNASDLPSLPVSVHSGRQSSEEVALTFETRTSFDQLRPQPSLSNPEAKSSPISAQSVSDEVPELETLQMDDSQTETETSNSTAFNKSSVTDRPRPIARGRSLSFSTRVTEFDHLMTMKRDQSGPIKLPKYHASVSSHSITSEPSSFLDQLPRGQSYSVSNHTTPESDKLMTSKSHNSTIIKPKRRNRTALSALRPTITDDHYPDINLSPRGRSHSLPGYIKPFDQPDPSELSFNMTDRSLSNGDSLELLCPPSALLSDSHGNHDVLEQQKLSSFSRAARFSAGSKKSFFSSIAKLDSDKTSLDLQLRIPDQKPQLLVETTVQPFFVKAPIVTLSKKSPISNTLQQVIPKVKKLQKSRSILKSSSRPLIHSHYDGTIDRLDDETEELMTTITNKWNCTLVRRNTTATTTNHSKYLQDDTPRPNTASHLDQVESNSDPLIIPEKVKHHKLKNIFKLQQHYHKLKIILVLRSNELSPLHTVPSTSIKSSTSSYSSSPITK